ncbi:MAG: hypothetical protein ACRDS0_29485 [Pseudonocardiaceae bacterium]
MLVTITGPFPAVREWDAADVLEDNLDLILPTLERRNDVWVRLSPESQPRLSFGWE